MPEWILVIVFGALGGFILSLIEVRGSIRTHFQGKDKVTWRRVRGWLLETVITAISAGAGSCLVWALYTTDSSHHATGIDTALAAESFIVGLGGVGAVRKYMQESARVEIAETGRDGMAVTAQELARVIVRSLDDRGQRGGEPVANNEETG